MAKLTQQQEEGIRKILDEWKLFISDNPKLSRTFGHHHYFRTRYSSKFFLKKIKDMMEADRWG